MKPIFFTLLAFGLSLSSPLWAGESKSGYEVGYSSGYLNGYTSGNCNKRLIPISDYIKGYVAGCKAGKKSKATDDNTAGLAGGGC